MGYINILFYALCRNVSTSTVICNVISFYVLFVLFPFDCIVLSAMPAEVYMSYISKLCKNKTKIGQKQCNS